MTSMHAQQRVRARDLGIPVGILPAGKLNAITDVAGVRVGHVTTIKNEDIRTGVTAILPHGANLFLEKVPAAVYVGNGFGKLTGLSQVDELGNIETPILLTSTLNVPRVADAVLEYMMELPGLEEVRSINPIVGEINDGFLNEPRKRPVGKDAVFEAIRLAHAGPVEEGSVGAGTGARCYGYKGGIGTSSRVLPPSLGGYTIGVLVLTNFTGILQIAGAPAGKELGRYYLRDFVEPQKETDTREGSCIIVVATDAALDSRNLKRLAQRAYLGLAVTGSPSTNGSGDYAIAFSTAAELRIPYQETAEVRLIDRKVLHDSAISPLFQAAKEATEEAVYNSLLMATTVKGRNGHAAEAIPIADVIKILKKYNVISP